MAAKLANFRVDVSRHTGEVMLLIDTSCGFRPVMGWPDRHGLKDFAETLLGISANIDEKQSGNAYLSDLNFLFGDDEN